MRNILGGKERVVVVISERWEETVAKLSAVRNSVLEMCTIFFNNNFVLLLRLVGHTKFYIDFGILSSF